jgi:two-component system nitrate/nitrite response regulator NarL
MEKSRGRVPSHLECSAMQRSEGRAVENVISVGIIHRNRLFREGVAYVLSQQQDITVALCSAEAGDAFADIEKRCPDVLILDFSQCGRDGLQEARQLCEAAPGAKLLVMGLTESEADILACIEAGAAGLLQREASLEELLQSIRAVGAGEALCPPKIVSLLFSQIEQGAYERKRLQLSGLPHLTPRERQILALLEEKCSNKEIAVQLQIEVQTVKNHVHNILEKLQLHTRREAAWYARERGFLGRVHER